MKPEPYAVGDTVTVHPTHASLPTVITAKVLEVKKNTGCMGCKNVGKHRYVIEGYPNNAFCSCITTCDEPVSEAQQKWDAFLKSIRT